MKKKYFHYLSALMLTFTLSCAFTACSDDDDPVDNTQTDNSDNDSDNNNDGSDSETVDAASLDYADADATAWGNYMYNVAALLKNDAANLNSYWSEDYNGNGAYGETFKNHSGSDYTSALSCVEEIVQKCAEIANEVGSAKIGDPYSLYVAGNTTEALYAVESWYSWHSRDDYTNNIWSIRNSYYGTVSANDNVDDADIQTHSLYNLIESLDAELNAQVDDAIHTAATAIQAIPQPFRNNIVCDESAAAMEACLDLEDLLYSVNTLLMNTYDGNANDEELMAIVAQYVDNVVLPTYADLAEKNEDLFDAVSQFRSNPSDSNFEAACEAWLVAREPWEKSEGFLFGPVDSEGLDPNMDSWPLDQDMIVQILQSGDFSSIEWDDDDDSSTIEAAQNVRGFHTLEYLIFKDGEPRTVK